MQGRVCNMYLPKRIQRRSQSKMCCGKCLTFECQKRVTNVVTSNNFITHVKNIQIKGTCNNDSECFYNQACVDYHCIDLCKPPSICGMNANCTTRAHKTGNIYIFCFGFKDNDKFILIGFLVCSCPDGFSGDPAQECVSLSVIPLF